MCQVISFITTSGYKALGVAKRDLLDYLERADEADATDVARAIGIRYSVAAMSLLRLVRQGLANRRLDPERGVYRYRISERGRSRLTYLAQRSAARRG